MDDKYRADIKVWRSPEGGWRVSINDQPISFWLTADGFSLEFVDRGLRRPEPVVHLKIMPTDLELDLPDVLATAAQVSRDLGPCVGEAGNRWDMPQETTSRLGRTL
jgi:hypothetical protein